MKNNKIKHIKTVHENIIATLWQEWKNMLYVKISIPADIKSRYEPSMGKTEDVLCTN